MNMKRCPGCDRVTGHKRAIGVGSLLAVIVTGGLWLIALPFYSERCIICGNDREVPDLLHDQPFRLDRLIFFSVVLIFIAIILIWGPHSALP